MSFLELILGEDSVERMVEVHLHMAAAFHSIQAEHCRFEAAVVVDNKQARHLVAEILGNHLVAVEDNSLVVAAIDLRTCAVVLVGSGSTPAAGSDRTSVAGTDLALADEPQLSDVLQLAVDDHRNRNTSCTSNSSRNTSAFGKDNRLHLEKNKIQVHI